MRLHRAGHQIVVTKHAQATHLKRWTLRTMVATDLFHRGIPWIRLIVRTRTLPDDLNVKVSQRISVASAFVLAAAAFISGSQMLWLAVLAVLSLLPPVGTGYLAGTSTFSPRIPYFVAAATAMALAALTVQLTFWSLVALGAVLAILLLNAGFYCRIRY